MGKSDDRTTTEARSTTDIEMKAKHGPPLAAACSVVAILMASLVAGAHEREPTPEVPSAIDVFRSPSAPGYGYEITTEDGARIRQPHMPAIPGKAGFRTPEDARTVAELVARRMRTGVLPTVSPRELDSLGVWTDNDPNPGNDDSNPGRKRE